ncbi:uncharacterized protein KY384_008703 [Bacidia gigantensis]|uniref:uncharacterized protein n=1 Tax=Bacidia gigantensis TaxID=2732470 RepID=UPI001D03A11B|nr:uncharacterized protein KY384_008703 [Bacidia gigantensis]KAG8526503.1 hypothetical protein KY384_008703 [Bacidia gigantensis]
MKSLRLQGWSGCVLTSRTRPSFCIHNQYPFLYRRSPQQHSRSTTTAVLREDDENGFSSDADSSSEGLSQKGEDKNAQRRSIRLLPSPPPFAALHSARLAALHARLALSPRLPIETLSRCLIDSTADPNPRFNNSSLALLGNNLLTYFTSEAILCRYPRLPTAVAFSAMTAYVGPKTLAALARQFGVEAAAEPGGEVDPGLLQFRRKEAGNASVLGTGFQLKEIEEPSELLSATRPNPDQMLKGWRRGVSSQTMYDDAFGEVISQTPATDSSGSSAKLPSTTHEYASADFVRALMGALYLHTGMRQSKVFYNAHVLSRHLDISALFSFRQPTRDLGKLCAREGFERPIARILAETGRKSRHPVFNVGIFSGREKLGEGSGGSLDEARIRAAISALKGWYLYSPLKVRVPSETVGKAEAEWEPVLIDGGEVVV